MTSYGHDNSKLARDYDRISAMQFETGKRLFERMGLQSGASVLDVGCGTGRLAEWIAAQVGPQGKVVGIDPLADRIALARDQVREVRFEIGYAEDLGAFADESFDGACLSAVFHWIPDKPKALAEIARVLRPGGRLGITTVPKDLHAASTMARVFASVFSLPAYRGRIRLDKFALAHQSVTVTETITMLLAAGLSLVELHVMERSQRRVALLLPQSWPCPPQRPSSIRWPISLANTTGFRPRRSRALRRSTRTSESSSEKRSLPRNGECSARRCQVVSGLTLRCGRSSGSWFEYGTNSCISRQWTMSKWFLRRKVRTRC